jgi:nitroimidazol reductase NimA-like FMN-containing flavoprotein (pyridoxamine 5'-phosphate oxidase superfamily)
MSTNPYAQFQGTPMDDDDIEDLLVAAGYGIVSLCRDGDPYSIPISFGFDGDDVYFGFLEDTTEPRKMAFIAEGKTARLLVTDIRGRFDWQSVAVTGPVRSVDPEGDEWAHFLDTLEDNGWFMRSFEQSDAVQSIQGWRLEPDEIRGLQRKEETLE